MKLYELIYENEYECEEEIPREIEIENLSRDYTKIEEGCLFFLIKSIKADDENIINYIKEKAPAVIVCKKGAIPEKLNSHVMYVENVRKIMAYAYSRFYGINYRDTKFIAITGTNGKTSTATMIKHILEYENETVGFIGTGKIEINREKISDEFYSMTTPDPEVLYPTISKMQKSGCKYIIMEASSHALYYDKLAPIEFEIGIFTNLSSEHLDFHNDKDSYYAAKLKLFSQCKIGIFNCDDKYARKAACEVNCRAITVGILWPADVTAREIIQNGLSGSEYIYKEKALIFKAKLSLPGAYNIYNSLLALKAVIVLGVKPCHAKEAISTIFLIEGRFEISKSDITVIRDYAHTPSALDNLIKTAKSIQNTRQKTIIVFGCGGDRDKTKRPLMAKIAEKNCDFAIVTSDNSRSESENEIIADILIGFENTQKRVVISDRKKAIEYAIMSAEAGDTVIISGKGCENYIIDKSGYHYFSEKEIVKDALEKRKLREKNYANKPGNSDFI